MLAVAIPPIEKVKKMCFIKENDKGYYGNLIINEFDKILKVISQIFTSKYI